MAWSQTSIDERRALLSLTIAQVVLEPLARRGEAAARHVPRRRELRIGWAPATKERSEAVVVVEPPTQLRPLRRVSEGRSEMMRELKAAKLREDRRLRAERSRAYYREWNGRRRHPRH